MPENQMPTPNLAGVLPERNHAIWIVPTADFQRAQYSKREWVRGILAQCANEKVAFHNWMERDAEFARWVTSEVEKLGLDLLRVDGQHTIEEDAMTVASYFELIDNVSGHLNYE